MNIIENIKDKISYLRYGIDEKRMNKKYGDCTLETDDIKFIWGSISGDDLSGHTPNLYTMNDIEIIYDKQTKEYIFSIETAYLFYTHKDECEYLQDCLRLFTKYMDDHKLAKDKPYILFMNNPNISMKAKSIEELYTNFKMFVDGFCNQNVDMDTCYYIEGENNEDRINKNES